MLREAIDSLATSAEPLQKRLEWADISLTKLKRDDFTDPKDLALFTSIRDTLSASGGIPPTTQALSDSQAKAAAKQIFELHGRYFPLSPD